MFCFDSAAVIFTKNIHVIFRIVTAQHGTMDEEDDQLDAALACSAEQAEADLQRTQEESDDQALGELVDAEEFLASHGVSMLEYERQMFFDVLHSDGLTVCAK